MYSCALWSDEEGGVRGDLVPSADPLSLERAQLRKIHHVLRAACVKAGDRILEFGSGWGGLSIEVGYLILMNSSSHCPSQAARSYGCEVDTLTLSIEQKHLAEKRIREHGLEGRIRVHLMDYRDLPTEWESAFDAFISVEMLEVCASILSLVYFSEN